MGLSLAQIFMEKLKRLKHSTIIWANEKVLRDKESLNLIKKDLEDLESLDSDEYETKEKREKNLALKGEMHRILKDIE